MVPAELKRLPQWVCWRLEERGGKPTKVPYRADGAGLAAVNAPESWTRARVAYDAWQVDSYNGIGFVLTAGDPYCGVDLDHCLEGDQVAPWAQTIVDRFASYTEVTPSGSGLRIWIRGRLPGKRNRTGSIELYDHERYFTMTGSQLEGTPATIEERQAELETFYAELFPPASEKPAGAAPRLTDFDVLDLARRAANGAKVEALLRGARDGYQSGSEADLALVSLLGFYTQDPGQLERLWRGSGLWREKAERQDYRERTIERALAELHETYSAGDAGGEIRHGSQQAPPPPGAELSTTASKVSIRPIKWLWPGRLPLGMLTGFDGDPERGKSQHLALMAAHITTGRPWPDGTPCPQGGAILVGAEDSWEQVVVPRLMAAGADLSRVELLSSIPTTNGANRLLTIPEDLPILEALVNKMGALMVGFDPLSAFLSDTVNANSEHDVRRALTPLAEMLDRCHCNAVALRHLSKNDKVGNALYRGLGSIGFNALARTTLGVAKDPETPGEFIFATIKNNVGRKPKPQRYRIESVQVSAEIEVSKIVWGSITEESPEELLIAFGKRPRRDAKELLLELLADGPVDAKLIWEAADSNQIASATLKRAKTDLGIIARKIGFQGAWEWSLPPDSVGAKEITARKGDQISGDGENLSSEDQRALHNILIPFVSKEAPISQRGSLDAFTHAPPHDAAAREDRRRLPCPECRNLAYVAGPAGPPERRCHGCGHVWVPA